MRPKPNAFRKFGNECPGGTDENSPAFQRWDVCHTRTSPEGTAERRRDPVNVQPSLRDSNSSDVLPGVETPGYSRVVPPGQWFAIRPGNFRKAFARGHARGSGRGDALLMPLELRFKDGEPVQAHGLLDSGATVNVLPYALGVRLGAVWEARSTHVTLAGNLAAQEARAVLVQVRVGDFGSVPLVFAWTSAEEVPLLLGQVNFLRSSMFASIAPGANLRSKSRTSEQVGKSQARSAAVPAAGS